MTLVSPSAAAGRNQDMTKKPPRLLIEEWLPAAAIGVECMRERSTGQQPPDKRFHVWWARRPLVVSRAAVLASLLPADFPRDVFERLSDEMHREVKIYCASEGIQMTELIRKLLLEHLVKVKKKTRKT
jgi:adenine-specific DNA methylase